MEVHPSASANLIAPQIVAAMQAGQRVEVRLIDGSSFQVKEVSSPGSGWLHFTGDLGERFIRVDAILEVMVMAGGRGKMAIG